MALPRRFLLAAEGSPDELDYDLWFRFQLAERLCMTVAELGKRMTDAELTGWKGFTAARVKLAERQAAQAKR